MMLEGTHWDFMGAVFGPDGNHILAHGYQGEFCLYILILYATDNSIKMVDLTTTQCMQRVCMFSCLY